MDAITTLPVLLGREDYYSRRLREKPEAEEKREAEEREARKARGTRHEQLQSAESWRNWAIAIADQRIDEAMHLGGMITAPVGEVIGRKAADVRKHALDEVAKLRRELDKLREELKATTAKLHERAARLPLVKSWEPDTVHYLGDVVVCNGSVFQAKRDTGRPVTSDDWILLAARGIDGNDGRTPRFRGAYLVGEKYSKFDVVRYDVGAFIAVRDNPGIIPTEGDGWQLLTLHGGRGPEGAVGPRGQKGERGPRGEAAPQIINWVLDYKRYTAVPTMSDGTEGPRLELRGLFEQFMIETAGLPLE